MVKGQGVKVDVQDDVTFLPQFRERFNALSECRHGLRIVKELCVLIPDAVIDCHFRKINLPEFRAVAVLRKSRPEPPVVPAGFQVYDKSDFRIKF